MAPDFGRGPAARVLSFGDLDGFAGDDLVAAFACFARSAAASLGLAPALRPANPVPPGLLVAQQAALALPRPVSHATALAFFESFFTPALVKTEAGDDAFLTGYYEPVVDGARDRSPGFAAPLVARPADLRTFAADEPRPAALAGFTAARVAPDGTLAPYPDRAAIEAAIEAGGYEPLVWLRDWVEVFLIHVQGSARVRLGDGRSLRLSYAGRNGHPYTSIGRLLAERGERAPETLSLDWLKGWIRAHGQCQGEAGRVLMQANASYIFFSAAEARDDEGPTGGEGLPLTAGRSIAVDRALWSYGLPVWIDARLPWERPEPTPFRRLTIAQDTGSAIVGPARADLFLGTGEAAGRRAGDIRHRGRFVVLRPRDPGAAP